MILEVLSPDIPPTSEILRHKRNRKWYALITDVSRNKVGLESDELIDILNVTFGKSSS